MLNLENLGVVELNAQEKQEVEGGLAFLGWVIIVAVCLLLASDTRN